MRDSFTLPDEEFRRRYPALWRRRERLRKKGPKSRIEKVVATRKQNRESLARHGCRWVEEEDRYLRDHWGKASLVVMERDLERSRRAVYERAQTLDLSPAREDMSLAAFERYSGFDRSKIRNACEVLGFKLRRGKRVRRWAQSSSRAASGSGRKSNRWFVPIDIQEELLAFLLENAERRIQARRGRWGIGRLPKHCRGCQSRSRPHYGRGHCRPCYDQLVRE